MRYLLLSLFALRLATAAPSVAVQYFYDQDRSRLALSEIAFSSPERGIVLGLLTEGAGRGRPVVLITSNGGAEWSLVGIKKIGISLYLLDDNHWWMVAADGIWMSNEGGRTWKKLSNPKGALRVHFTSPTRGFAVGFRKKIWETRDGGKTWTDVAAAAAAKGDPEVTAYTWITFVDNRAGIITGNIRPKVRRTGYERNLPAWIDPDGAARRVVPRVQISLDTRDGGDTWTPSAASMFGDIHLVRMSALGWALGLVRFPEGFEYPSEVYLIHWKSGANSRLYRDKAFQIHDMAIVSPQATTYLAGVEQSGALIDSPVPRRVRILESANLSDWKELEVDFRASATAVHAATAGGKVWFSTDSGMILTLKP